MNRGWTWAFLAAMVLGAGLRLVWVEDMEFKGEERFTFDVIQRIGVSEPFPWTGMTNSAGVPHPGMSVWAFWLLGKAFQVETPTDLTRACQCVNVAAVLALPIFVWRAVPCGQREPWFWAAALAALNPLAVLFHRKIWPPSILPPFSLVFLLGWWFRDRRWGAFLWGFIGAILGQIHPGGFLFAAGFAGWAALFRRHDVRWRWALAGAGIGIIPAIPWLVQLFFDDGPSVAARRNWVRALGAQFWWMWMSEPFGIGLNYALGRDYWNFLRSPIHRGHATFLVLAVHVLIAKLTICVLGRGLMYIWRQRQRWREWFVGAHCPTALTQNAALWGYGLLLTLTGLPIYRHYLIITFPLMFVWLARLALIRTELGEAELTRGRRLLTGLCVGQGLLTVGFLSFVHEIDRPIRGDYGAPYRVQRLEASQWSHGRP